MVEEALLTSPDVESAVAIGAPDPLRCNTDIQALVVLKRGARREGSEARLIELCRERLQPYEVPGRIDIVESLPMNSMGKVDRVAVAAKIERRVQKAMDDYARERKAQKS
jgi:acyl-coenzyme A synthetase/AMP-(fatty) acid ligase